MSSCYLWNHQKDCFACRMFGPHLSQLSREIFWQMLRWPDRYAMSTQYVSPECQSELRLSQELLSLSHTWADTQRFMLTSFSLCNPEGWALLLSLRAPWQTRLSSFVAPPQCIAACLNRSASKPSAPTPPRLPTLTFRAFLNVAISRDTPEPAMLPASRLCQLPHKLGGFNHDKKAQWTIRLRTSIHASPHLPVPIRGM